MAENYKSVICKTIKWFARPSNELTNPTRNSNFFAQYNLGNLYLDWARMEILFIIFKTYFKLKNWHQIPQRYVEYRCSVGYRKTNEIFVAI